MKKNLIIILLLTVSNSLLSQDKTCPTEVNLSQMQIQDPVRYQRFADLENFTNNYISNQNNPNGKLINQAGIITIPVVIHVLHRGEAIGTGRNVSVAQIQSQIDVLNEDFRRLNADKINTPNDFLNVASDFNFEFKLTCQDPNGNATNGIVRKLTNKETFQFLTLADGVTANEIGMGIKMSNISGDASWPTNKYLNIWVADFGATTSTAGYSTFPADYSLNPNWDGVVINTMSFGRIGNLRNTTDRGRTTTHEIGHWLNLFHLWGNGQCGTDFVNDTPPQALPNATAYCPAYPHLSICLLIPNYPYGDMFMNYMDYTSDGCQNIFTNGQKLRAKALFSTGGPRADFINNYFNVQQPANSIPCSGGYVSLNNLICLTPTWSIVSGNATIASGQSTNKVLITATASGSVVIRATAGNYIDEKTIQIVPPSSSDYTMTGGGSTTQPLYWCSNKTYSFSINGGPASNYVWTIPAGWTSTYNGGYVNALKAPSGTTPPTGTVSVTFTPACGGGTITKSFYTANSSSACTGTDPRFTYSPNPAPSYLNVAVASGYTSTVSIKRIQIIGVSTGLTVFDQSYGTGVSSAFITTSGFQTGTYNLRIYDGTAWAVYQFVR